MLAFLKNRRGTSLIEVLLAMAIFIILSLSIFFTYGNILEIVGRSEHTNLATTLLNREIEIIRNLEFEDIGVQNGYPPGVIPQQITKNFQGMDFQIHAFVRNIDDSFDGTVTSTPKDSAPADYKLVELRAECDNCVNYQPLSITSYVAAAGLESASENGSLFINVFDANGQPVSGADITVSNSSTSPTISISDTSNVDGQLQLVDVPTSTNSYKITVAKTGYSTSQTHEIGLSGNPNPTKPHATVASQELTTISFSIDKVSTVNIQTDDAFCNSLGNIHLQTDGTKLIGSGPDVLKYSQELSTDNGGSLTFSNVEWDTYTLTNTSSSYQILGSSPIVPLVVNPNETINLDFVLVPNASSSLRVKVINASGTAITSATVKLADVSSSATYQRETEHWSFGDSDWSAGNYSAQPDGNIDDNNPAGSLTLKQSSGSYATGTWSTLTSNTFDLGTSTTTMKWLSLLPSSQPSNTSAQLQIASNNDNATWNFIGPNGTSTSYYNPAVTSTISTAHNGDRYFRYQLTLNSSSSSKTPTIDDVALEFTSPCIPDGHALFTDLATSTYDIEVTASGYSLTTSSVTIGTGLQEEIIEMQ